MHRLLTSLCIMLLSLNIAGATLPSADFTLTGSGNLRWFGLKIYTASLWRGLGTDAAQLLLIEYDRSVSQQRLYTSTRKEWLRMHGEPDASVAAWLTQLEALYPDVRKGSRLACVVERDGPTRFYLDDNPIGSIPDPGFGPAFLAIWLDPATSRPGLRRKLLGLE